MMDRVFVLNTLNKFVVLRIKKIMKVIAQNETLSSHKQELSLLKKVIFPS